MQIANPIYDVVFKYLMEDGKIAKLMLSSIIGEKIEELTFLPQEFISDIDKTKSSKKTKTSKKVKRAKSIFTVYRLDFSAKIKTSEGYKQVVIELQKAKFPTDIMRFRKYLGEQFSNKENTQRIQVKKKTRKTGIPLISIYFLGHKLDYTEASAIKINRQYIDLMTGDVLEIKESFIESLTLDSYVIQIPFLTNKRRNDLEILLSIFDQRHISDKEHHILNVNETEFPEKYRPIIRKLQEAIENIEIKKKMELEDGLIDELEDLEREIEDLEQENEQVKQENEQVKQENEQVKQENEQVKFKLDTVEQEKERVEQEKERVEQENMNLKLELEKFRNLLNDKN